MNHASELAANHVNGNDLPYFPYAPGVDFKLIKVNRVTGQFAIILKSVPGAQLGTHRHYGPVWVYTIEGKWRYEEDPFVATAGSVVFEPAGAVHTFRSDPTQGITAFIIVDGALEFLDESGRTLFIDNWQSILKKYLDFCAGSGIEPVDVSSF
jgi:2,4'-dihydroxyacetophenone dioxygenase